MARGRKVRARMNWKIVLWNIAEAREELQRLEKAIEAAGQERSQEFLEVGLGHAYHHLNFAWRARHWTIARYRAITQLEFDSFGQFPRDVWLPRSSPRTRRRAS